MLDYGIASRPLSAWTSATIDPHSPWRPHAGIVFSIQKAVEVAWSRQLVVALPITTHAGPSSGTWSDFAAQASQQISREEVAPTVPTQALGMDVGLSLMYGQFSRAMELWATDKSTDQSDARYLEDRKSVV